MTVAAPVLPIRTERLVLRGYRLDDVEATLAYYSDPEVARFLLDDPWTRHQTEETVAKRCRWTHIADPDGALSLVVVCDDAVIGDVVLWPVDGTMSRGELGWVFRSDAAGHGYATEAARALIDLAFDHYGMHRVKAELDARNSSSIRLCERLAMTREAYLRQDLWSKGEWTDTIVYGLLATDGRSV